MTKLIELTQGKQAIVDDEDFEWLSQWKWCAVKSRKTFYAARASLNGRSKKMILMHRIILSDPIGMEVDHRDQDGLNNRRHNLRKATRGQNSHNYPKPTNNKSGFKGVSWSKASRKWRASIQVNGKEFNLGNFENAINAAYAYDKAAIKYFGDFAYINFPSKDS